MQLCTLEFGELRSFTKLTRLDNILAKCVRDKYDLPLSLKYLGIAGGESKKGIQSLSYLTNLTSLFVRGTGITDEGFEYLTNLTSLEVSTNKGITPEGIMKLTNLTELEHRALEIPDSCVLALPKLIKVKRRRGNKTNHGKFDISDELVY